MLPKIKKRLILTTLGIIIASISLHLSSSIFIAKEDLTTIILEESLEDLHIGDAKENTGKIEAHGYWNIPIVGISFDTSGLEYSEQASELAFQAIEGTGSIPSEDKFTGWHIVFHAILEAEGKEPVHLIIVDEKDAVIKLQLINDEHPQGKVGKAVLTINKITKEMISAEVTIYRSDELYKRSRLDEVLIHEIGHALGLGHASLEGAIMYPVLPSDNSTYYEISRCELAGMKSLYLEHRVSEAKCNP